MSNNSNHKPSGFFYREEVITWILRIFYACCIILASLDFLIDRHTERSFEKFPTFYALYGLIACVILVFIAKWMRILLIRDENFYDEPESPKDFLEKQGLDLPQTENQATNTIKSDDKENG
jgi:hypothetical protein